MLSEAVSRIVVAAEEADSRMWESLAEEGFYVASSASSDESEQEVAICGKKKMLKKGKKACSAPKRSLKVEAEKVVPRKSDEHAASDLIALRTIVSAPF